MTKTFFAVFAVILVLATPAAADMNWNGTYCVIDYPAGASDGQCYWCTAGGTTAAGNCKKGYAGCVTTTEKYVSVGSYAGDWKCTSSGFCMTSCDSSKGYWGPIKEVEGADVWYELSGCRCDSYIANTLHVRCSAGYYGTPDRYVYTGCQRCPSLTNASGETVYGLSDPENNKNITDCWIDGLSGPFADESGTYDIEGPMCMYML